MEEYERDEGKDLEDAAAEQQLAPADPVDQGHVESADRHGRGGEPDRLKRIGGARHRGPDCLKDVREEEAIRAGDETPDPVHEHQEGQRADMTPVKQLGERACGVTGLLVSPAP